MGRRRQVRLPSTSLRPGKADTPYVHVRYVVSGLSRTDGFREAKIESPAFRIHVRHNEHRASRGLATSRLGREGSPTTTTCCSPTTGGGTSYELADGSVHEYPFGLAQIEFMGEVTAGRVIFGPDGVEPILGVTALESVGITIDPTTRTLKRLPAVPLK